MSVLNNIPKDQLKEFTGFTVYDAETGDKAKSYGRDGDDDFMLDQDGGLFQILCDYVDSRDDGNDFLGRQVIEVKKEGKYIIQFGDGSYMEY